MNKTLMLAAACAFLAAPASATQIDPGQDSTAHSADATSMIVAQMGVGAGRGGSVAPPMDVPGSESGPVTSKGANKKQLKRTSTPRGKSVAPPMGVSGSETGMVNSGGGSPQQLKRTPGGRGKSVAPPMGAR